MITLNNSKEGNILNLELKGNTIQDSNNLNIESVGVEIEGTNTFKVNVLSCNLLDKENINYKEDSREIILPCKLESVENVRDRFYYDGTEWAIEKWVDNSVILVEAELIKTGYTDPNLLNLKTFEGTTYLYSNDVVSPIFKGIFSKSTKALSSINNKQLIGINKEINNIKNLKDNVLTQHYSTDNGFITINNSKDGYIDNMTIEGNTQLIDGNLRSVGELEGNKIEVLSNNKNLLKPASDYEESKPGLTSSLINGVLSITGTSSGIMDIKYTSHNPEYEVLLNHNKIYRLNFYVLSDENSFSHLCRTAYKITMRDGSVKWLGGLIQYPVSSYVINGNDVLKVSRVRMYSANKGAMFNNFQVRCQLEIGEQSTEYISHQSNKKEILLNEPLRGFPSRVKDRIKKIGNKWQIERNCGERTYQTGDETNPNVITDMVRTVYQLATPTYEEVIDPTLITYLDTTHISTTNTSIVPNINFTYTPSLSNTVRDLMNKTERQSELLLQAYMNSLKLGLQTLNQRFNNIEQ